MPRPLRINYCNAWYHVMNRGAGQQNIFKNNMHRKIFLEIIEECHKIFNLKIYAYCLMYNHYHLLVSTPDANLPRIMRHINGVYTQKYNLLTNKDGSLFRGRYKAQLIEEDCYQLIVSRYIHLNPAEASIVNNPADYKWSSYRAYLGLEKPLNFLSADTIISQFANTKALSHVKNYQDYVEEKSIDEISVFKAIRNSAPIIGSELFKTNILSTIDKNKHESCSTDFNRARTTPDIELIVWHVCTYYNITRESMICSKRGKYNLPKQVCMYICRSIFCYTLRGISQYMHLLRYEAVSTVIRKFSLSMIKNPSLQEDIDNIVALVNKEIIQQK